MDVVFRTHKLERIFNNREALVKEYGRQCAQKIIRRMWVLHAAPSLAAVPTRKPDRCHELRGNRRGVFAVDLAHPFRLVFEPYVIGEQQHTTLRKEEVTAIRVLGVEDYH